MSIGVNPAIEVLPCFGFSSTVFGFNELSDVVPPGGNHVVKDQNARTS